jgi:hypothetical protein
MRRAGDAGIVIANGLLTLPGKFFVWKINSRWNETPQVAFDGFLIL